MILSHLLLIALWVACFAMLFYNALEHVFLKDPIPGYLGLCGLLLILIHLIFLVVRIIHSVVTKQYIMSLIYLVLLTGLAFIAKTAGFVTMIYFGMGTTG